MDFQKVFTHSIQGNNPHLDPHDAGPSCIKATIINTPEFTGKNDSAISKTLDEDLNISNDLKFLSLIGKVFGEAVPLKVIMAKMTRNWYKVKGDVIFTLMGNDFFLVWFMNDADYNFVWEKRPWYVEHQVFVLEKWI
ncbi:hypothetical protein L1049_016523 [Liquidambar formosana]|uniref:DUF4283 domain-containing protein n=1 Tax=Liquidambar formosana TaxID=63359 RepID=A0AAP0S697_LIQFO